MSVQSKVLKYLSKDSEYNTLTAQKMRSTWGVANPSALINNLRNEGYPIYSEKRVTSGGEKVTFYRLGTPTRRMIAAGIAALREQYGRVF